MIKLSEKELEIIEENLKAYGIKGKLSEATISQLKSGTITGSAFEQALKQIGVEGENLTNILGKLSSHSLESSDAQEKFNKSLDSAKETFSKFVNGKSLDILANQLTNLVKSIEIKGFWSTLFGGVATEKDIKQYDVTQKKVELAQTTGNTAEDVEKRAKLIEEIKKDEQEIIALKEKENQAYLNNLSEVERHKVKVSEELGYNPYAISEGPKFAVGGIVTSPINNATVGEAGP
jgi:hypothetical protein